MPRRILSLITLLTAAGCIVIIGAMGMGTGRPRQHLAFASNHIIGQTRLYLMDVPRGLMSRLSDRPTNGGLHWSPDGEWLAFEDALEGAYFRLAPFGGDLTNLTPLDSFSYGLAWLPDSQSVVYARNGLGAEHSGIFQDEIHGAFSERLHPAMLFPGTLLLPAAGGRLLYTDSDADALGQLIYSLEPDGSSRLVVDTGRYVDDMALAPDGQRLAYTRAQPDGYYEIGLVDLACLGTADSCSNATLLLTQNSIRDQGPVWSPDGQRIAYRQLEGGLMSIRLLTLATGETVTVTTPASSYANVQWSPDGRWLSFTSNRGSIPALYALDLTCLEQTGGCMDQAQLLLVNSFVSASPVWQPGG